MQATERPNHRVFVVGLGAVTSQGEGAAALWEGVRDGHVAIGPVDRLSMDGYRTRIGGEVAHAETEADYPRPEGFREPALDYALRAADEAVAGAGLSGPHAEGTVWGVAIGTCNAGLVAALEWYRHRGDADGADPRLTVLAPPNAMAEVLAARFDCTGPVVAIDTACAASANAIGYGGDMVRSGRADVVIAGGADAFSDVLIAGFNSLESLSPEPAAPYSADRQGLSLGEGAGVLVLMRADLATQLGVTPLAELGGYGLSADGYHATAPHPEGLGAARAIQAALTASGLVAGDVDYVNSHGTGTAKNDPAETAATKAGLGEDVARRIAVSSSKSMIGHLLGGAGAAEAIVTVRALTDGIVPPTANFTTADPECDLDYVPNASRAADLRVAVSNNFAFGGANASLVLLRPDVRDAAAPLGALDRVVITGVAARTAAGSTPQALLDGWRDGAPSSLTDEDGIRVGRVTQNPADTMSPRERRRVDRLGLFSIVTAREALADAGLDLTAIDATRVATLVGTGVGPMESMEAFAAPVMAEGAAGANPGVFPNTVYNAAGGQVAMKVGALGPASTVCCGHASGAVSLAYAADLLAGNCADAALAIGVDTLTAAVLDAYRQLGILSPAGGGDGFALAEGAAALLLERAAYAAARGARVLGEVVAHAETCDARGAGRIDPGGHGIERAMRLALERAGLDASEIGSIWGAGCGWEPLDASERAAVTRLFGSDERLLTPKATLGEPIGAAPSVLAVMLVSAWASGAVKPAPAIVNGCSLGGTNASLILVPPGG